MSENPVLQKLSLKALRELARGRLINGYSHAPKAKIVSALIHQQRDFEKNGYYDEYSIICETKKCGPTQTCNPSSSRCKQKPATKPTFTSASASVTGKAKEPWMTKTKTLSVKKEPWMTPTLPAKKISLPRRSMRIMRNAIMDKIFKNQQQRGILYNAIQQGKIANCHVDHMIKNFTPLGGVGKSKKISASQILLLLGEFPAVRKEARQGVALKMSFQACDPAIDNSLEIERLAYQYHINPLFFNQHTPHVVLKIGDFVCPNFTQAIDNAGDKRDVAVLRRRLLDLKGQLSCDTDVLNVTMLERGAGKTFYETMSSTRENIDFTDFFSAVVFQVIYTLTCFQEIGFMQNDLHGDNILIDVLDKPQTNFYQARLNGKVHTWKITSRYFVKIFDFDRATSSATPYNNKVLYNTSILRLQKYGVENEFVPFYDAFAFFAVLIPIIFDIVPHEKVQWARFFLWNAREIIEYYVPDIFTNAKDHHNWCVWEDAAKTKCSRGSGAPDMLYDLLANGFADLEAVAPPGAEIWRLPSSLK